MKSFYDMTREELEKLGFRLWNKESGIMLMPESLYDVLPIGSELVSILGEKVIKGKDYIDDEARNGLLAYGIVPRS